MKAKVMKLNVIVAGLLLFNGMNFVVAHEGHDHAVDSIVASPVKQCSCGPIDHVLSKICVKIYNQQFPQANLPENNDTEGISANIVEAMNLFLADLTFIDIDGNIIAPEMNAKGKLHLKMGKVIGFKLYKKIITAVDLNSTLTAQELYEQWTEALALVKSAQ